MAEEQFKLNDYRNETAREYEYGEIYITSEQLFNKVVEGWMVCYIRENRSNTPDVMIRKGNEIVISLRRPRDDKVAGFI